MTCDLNGSKVGAGIKQLCDEGFDSISGVEVTSLNQAMKLDRSRHLQAKPYERSEEAKAN